MISRLKQLYNQLMLENKSNYSETVRSMTHGRPSNMRCGQPCMYEILHWDSPSKCQKNNSQKQKHCPVTQSCIHQRILIQQQQNNEKYENRNEDFYPQNQRKVEQKMVECKVHKKGHQIKNQLYMIEQAKLKKSHSVDFQNNKQSPKSPQRTQARKQVKKLDINDEKDKKIIEEREERIKEFKYFTRDLPNSAFTTYYGKPAFESYGRCSSNVQMKTHNVMPHKGENNPKQPQSYTSALYQGKKINHENHLPRKPLKVKQKPIKTEDDIPSMNTNLPLQKPDLVNHIRFSNPDLKKIQKEGIPSQSKSSSVIKKKIPEKPKKSKNKKKHQSSAVFNDGLKYMNMRTDLLDLLEKKKTKDSKLAYKVTECYPLDWECEKQCNLQTNYDKFNEMRPAGREFVKGDDAKSVIYQKLKKKQLKL